VTPQTLKQVELWSLAWMILSVIASLTFKQPIVSLSIFIGFLFSVANYWILKRLLGNVFLGSKTSLGMTPIKLISLLVIKYIAMFALLGLCVIYFNLHLLGLLIGVSSLVLAIVSVAAKEALKG